MTLLPQMCHPLLPRHSPFITQSITSPWPKVQERWYKVRRDNQGTQHREDTHTDTALDSSIDPVGLIFIGNHKDDTYLKPAAYEYQERGDVESSGDECGVISKTWKAEWNSGSAF